ncbi:hypothetical protein CN134_37365 [Sinorhizobium meliloti]|nr:hypothetical protein CN134_37365 [Sinorhizobium meliloti]RVO20580.1 hypothetical protein CN098_34800 [Sinorhizobium meliloti]
MTEQYRPIEEIVDDEDVRSFTELGDNRYGVQKFDMTDHVRRSFDDLPLDPYCGAGRGAATNGKHRYRRYDDFKATYSRELGKWQLELLPHRPFIQHPKFNKAVGGIPRELPALKIKPDAEMNSILNAFGFDKDQPIHAKIH